MDGETEISKTVLLVTRVREIETEGVGREEDERGQFAPHQTKVADNWL